MKYTYTEPATNEIFHKLPRIWKHTITVDKTIVTPARPARPEIPARPAIPATDTRPEIPARPAIPAQEATEETSEVIQVEQQVTTTGLTHTNCESYGWVITEIPYVAPPYVEPVPQVYLLAKVELLKFFDSRGLGDAFFAMLEADPKRLQYWNASVVLDSDDEMVQDAMNYFVANEVLTQEEAEQALIDCRSVLF